MHNHSLNESEREVAEQYVDRLHLMAIATAANLGNFAVSFRDAGASTLRCLRAGAPAKGHDILEKTVKAGSLRAAYGEAHVQQLTAAVGAAGIDGYVGHWREGRLAGLYMDPAIHHFRQSQDPAERSLAAAVRYTPDGKPYYPVDLADLDRSLATLKSVRGWGRLPFTGDYDTHDMIGFDGARGARPSGSGDERRIVAAINAAVAAIDPFRPMDKEHHLVVQHGPQYNYVAHVLHEEAGTPLVGAVARPDFPVAMCDRGVWSLIRSQDELQGFYRTRKLNLKSTWREDGDTSFENVGDGHVSLRRKSSTPSLRSMRDARESSPLATYKDRW
jgi:hypothetical protein